MKALLVVSMLAAPNLSQPVAQSAADDFSDAFVALSANALCQKDMFDVAAAMRQYAKSSGISNPQTVVKMVSDAAEKFASSIIEKKEVAGFCAQMRAFKGKHQ